MRRIILLFIAITFLHSTLGYINPVQAVHDSPDPGVLKDVDGNYYAVTTGGWGGQHFPIWKSSNLGSWSQVGFGFKSSPSWTDGGDFWAP